MNTIKKAAIAIAVFAGMALASKARDTGSNSGGGTSADLSPFANLPAGFTITDNDTVWDYMWDGKVWSTRKKKTSTWIDMSIAAGVNYPMAMLVLAEYLKKHPYTTSNAS